MNRLRGGLCDGCSVTLLVWGAFGVDDWLEAEGEIKDTQVNAAAA